MVTNEGKVIAIFASNNQTVLLYRKLKNKGYKVELLIASNQISKGCTKGLRFCLSDIDIVKEEIKKNKLKCEGIYKKIRRDNKITYIAIEYN